VIEAFASFIRPFVGHAKNEDDSSFDEFFLKILICLQLSAHSTCAFDTRNWNYRETIFPTSFLILLSVNKCKEILP